MVNPLHEGVNDRSHFAKMYEFHIFIAILTVVLVIASYGEVDHHTCTKGGGRGLVSVMTRLM